MTGLDFTSINNQIEAKNELDFWLRRLEHSHFDKTEVNEILTSMKEIVLFLSRKGQNDDEKNEIIDAYKVVKFVVDSEELDADDVYYTLRETPKRVEETAQLRELLKEIGKIED